MVINIERGVPMMIVSKIRQRWWRAVSDEAGMSTVEYAIGTIAAAAFAAVLYKVVTGGAITTALTDLVQQALSVKF
jgi:hypothetical protein